MSQPTVVTLAGTVTVRPRGTTARELALGPHGRVAFAYLLLERHRPVGRDELAEAVWGEDLPETWRPALRLLVSRVRTALEEAGAGGREVVRSVGGCYQLRLADDVVVDVESAADELATGAGALAAGDPGAAFRRATWAADVARHRFLPGDGGAWVERRQAEVQRLLVDALDLVSRSASAVGEHATAAAAAQEIVGLEPWQEEGHVRLVGAHVAGGNLPAARRAYDDCRAALAGELGVAPSTETAATCAGLIAGAARPPPPGNLRQPVSTFVGRDAELAALAELGTTHRVLTLVGPAGVGKSRLAVELAGRSASAYADGVWAAELAGLAPDGPVAHHLLGVLGLPEVPGRAPAVVLVEHLAGRRALLVLDNCEHVLDACAALVAELAGRCPGLAVVATSRVPLAITGEAIWTVAPLAVPGPDESTASLAALLRFDAVRLFAERAAAASPTLALDEVSGSVARICRQLDGLPLAIELTAARTRTVAVPEIEARLGDRFRFLVSGGRRTLEAAIDWSYGNLGPTERRVLAAVAVFVGGFGLDGARAVCPLPDAELVDALATLVDQSLLVADHLPGTVRYRLLETMRQYGLEKLAAEGDGAGAAGRARHLDWACALAEAAAPCIDGPEQAEWLGVLEAEEENFRAALDWAEASGASGDGPGARLAVALWRFWEIRGRLDEGRARLEAMAARPGAPAPVRARALNGAGILAQRQCDWPAARRLYQASLVLHGRLGNRAGMAAARNGLANLAVSSGDLDRAEGLYAENVAIGRDMGDDRLLASSLMNLAVVHQFLATSGGADRQAALARARAHCEQSLLLYRGLGDRHSQAMVLENLGSLAALQGDFAISRRRLDESLALRRDLGDRVGIAASSRFLGQLARRDGRHDTARTLHEQSLSLERELGNDVLAATDLLTLGEIAADQSSFADARDYFERSLVMYRGMGDDAGSERALVALAGLGDR